MPEHSPETYRIRGREVRKGTFQIGVSVTSLLAFVGVYASLFAIDKAPHQYLAPLAGERLLYVEEEVVVLNDNQKRILDIVDRVEAENVERDFQRLVVDCTADGIAQDLCFQRARDEMRRRRALERDR